MPDDDRPWWRRFVEGKADEGKPDDEEPPAAENPDPWRCCDTVGGSSTPCFTENPPEARRCQRCSCLRPGCVDPELEQDGLDATEYVPNIEVGFSNVPRSWRRRPNYEEVSRVYGWRPPWM